MGAIILGAEAGKVKEDPSLGLAFVQYVGDWVDDLCHLHGGDGAANELLLQCVYAGTSSTLWWLHGF